MGIQFRRAGSDDPEDKDPFAVVGVVANARTISLSDPDPMMIYVPYWYRCDGRAGLLIHAEENSETIAPMIKQAIWSVDRSVSIANIQPFGKVVESSLASQRFVLDVALLFAISSLILAALGVYAVVNYSVTHRRKEIGLRLALGASRRSLYKLVLREGLAPVLLGIAVGLILALSLARPAKALLFGVSPYDPATTCLTVAILLLVGIVACILPARSAALSGPTQALRAG